MNPKIKELAKNDLIHSEYTESGCQECHYYQFDPDELQKFAELIIQECLTAIECGKPEIVSPEMRLLVSEDIYSHWKFYEPKD